MDNGLRKKKPHRLYECKNGDDFLSSIHEIGIDIFALIEEFVDLSYSVGVILGGSIPEQTATSVSDVDVTLLITDPRSFKSFKPEVWGSSVFYLHKDLSRQNNWIVIFINGVEINLEIKFNPAVSEKNGANLRSNSNAEDINEIRFLSRLTCGWPLLNASKVKLWREYYCVDEIRERRTISEFTLALKELEDMKASVGMSPGLPYVLGVHIVTRLIKSVLATESYLSPGLKWMRKVNQLCLSGKTPVAVLLSSAKPLLFPGYSEREDDERCFYKNVVLLAKEVENYIVSENMYVGDVLDWFKTELDLVLEEGN